jgi:uncharacterized protein
MHVAYPLRFDGRDRTAVAGDAQHVRDLIEQVLFTMPGERVNRPDFGSGVMQLVFAPNSPELAATTEFLVKGSLQQWLGDLITVEGVAVAGEDATLRVRVDYTVTRTGEHAAAELTRGGTP